MTCKTILWTGCIASAFTYLSFLRARFDMLDGISAMLICAVTAFYWNRIFKTRIFFYTILSFVYIVFMAAFVQGISFFKVFYYSLAYVMSVFSSFSLFIMLVGSGDYKMCSRFVIVTMIFVLITSAITINADANASRLLAGNAYALGVDAEAKAESSALSGVAGYQFIHAIPFVGLALVNIWKNTFGLKKIIILIANLFLFVMTVRSGFSTAIFMYAGLLLFGMFGSKYWKGTLFIGSLLFICMIVMWKVGLIYSALSAIKPYVGESQFANKIEALEESRYGHYGSSYINGRSELYKDSWDSFKRHPIVGDMQSKTGGHSGGLDMLAKYGIVGFSLCMLPFFSAFIVIIRCIPISQRWYLCLAIGSYFIFYFLKAPAHKTQMYTLLTLFSVLVCLKKDQFQYTCSRIRRYFGLPPLLMGFN